MTDADQRFHETWLGMVQPVDGLVVSIPALVEAQCHERQPPHVQAKLLQLCPPRKMAEGEDTGRAIGDLAGFLGEMLGYERGMFDAGEAVPEDLALWVPEGRQSVRPTMGLRKRGIGAEGKGAESEGSSTTATTTATTTTTSSGERADTTPASRAGDGYEMLVWRVPRGLDLDRAEVVTGAWDYPPDAKFDRLLRHCRVPIGLLTNDEVVRLVYAPHGESSGSITFRLDDMASVGGRPILDAFVMLLSANRFFGVAEAQSLPAILADSRKKQAAVTEQLAEQVFDALRILLAGFESAAERDGRDLLDEALAREGDHLYKGLLTVMLRLVFVLYAEDRGLLPVEHPVFAEHYSLLAMYERLQADRGAWPDSMSRRFGAWGQLIAIFRAVYLGVEHGTLHTPPRRGDLFDPHRYPFLEGWGPAGASPITLADARAAVRVPTVDDETVFRVLDKLLVLGGQRLSYRALDVEQIGSVYEGLMGFHVVRMTADSVCMRPYGLWVSADEVMAVKPAQRVKWLKETVGITTAQAEKVAAELIGETRRPHPPGPLLPPAAARRRGGKTQEDSLEPLDVLARFGKVGRGEDPRSARARVGQLVLQPGTERRRTSSHYTPRSLSAPIVQRTLEPLLAVMGDTPGAERILSLKVCDPAMGSGAFLVEACRFLADHVVAAWTREGAVEAVARDHGDPLLHARRLVAQRCLYGVDKNEAAVELAKLSLWLVTLARDLPFTFVDHALRHGDSLVGLDFEQIRSFHWKPGKQMELFTREVDGALDEAIAPRERILALAASDRPEDQREKETLLRDAHDALDRVRLIADVCVGAFFATEKDKAREKERDRRLDLLNAWLKSDAAAGEELRALQSELRARVPAFHWHVEFPEVFYAARPDPLDEMRVNGAAYMDAFVGNPPFAGKNGIIAEGGPEYLYWLVDVNEGTHGNADLCAYFFRRAFELLGHHGTLGLIATNTISQGDTRASGLQWLLRHGAIIRNAVRSTSWPGDAAVTVSIIHIAKGLPASLVTTRSLDGRAVPAIDSRLRGGREEADPRPLAANSGLAIVGHTILGSGFTLTAEERQALVRTRSENAQRIFPLLGGEEVNSGVGDAFQRYVINFAQLDLQQARMWPDLIGLIEQRVKPERDKLGDGSDAKRRRLGWWKYGQYSRTLADAIGHVGRCLVTATVTKHLCFSFQPTDRVFSHKLYVFPFEDETQFSLLQSRVHVTWAWLLSSTMKTDLNYSASDCFSTFPFPHPDPRAVIPALESVGERLYTARTKYMVDENVGLTITYNRLKDPACDDARIVELRAMHEQMDREVLRAYGWEDIVVPAYCGAGDAWKRGVEAFEGAIVDRLFELNAKRAEEERVLGVGAGAGGAGKKGAKGKGKKSGDGSGNASGEKRAGKRAKGAGDGGTPGLPGVG